MPARLTAATAISKIIVRENGCWIYPAAPEKTGYIRIRIGGRKIMSHRVAWEFFFGAIPEGMEPDHLCRNTECCNPAHIEIVTPRQNCLRKPRRTTCFQGHPWSHRFRNDRVSDGWQMGCMICHPRVARRPGAEVV